MHRNWPCVLPIYQYICIVYNPLKLKRYMIIARKVLIRYEWLIGSKKASDFTRVWENIKFKHRLFKTLKLKNTEFKLSKKLRILKGVFSCQTKPGIVVETRLNLIHESKKPSRFSIYSWMCAFKRLIQRDANFYWEKRV